jgi:hypothetical protein
MFNLGSKDKKIKVSAVFGIIALVLSLFLGIISGVPIITVLVRSVIMTLVFSGLGFAIIFIISKYVPEMNSVLSGKQSSDEIDVDIDGDIQEEDVDIKTESDSEGPGAGDEASQQEGEKDDSFTELTSESFPNVTESVDPGSSDSSKLGKHIVKMEEGFNKFEPKLMAEAVRTMMSKDED